MNPLTSTRNKSRRHAASVRLAWLIVLICVSTPGMLAAAPTEPTGETLAVFVQSGADPAAEHFRTATLPELTTAVEALGIEVRVHDVTEGAPEEVSITPLMVFHGYRGRAIYQGRAFDVGKLVHFIRTRRAVPVPSEPYIRQHIPVLVDGRSVIAAPIKITPLAGNLPEGFNGAAFLARARYAIDYAFERFGPRDAISLGPADRQFYMDFHPFRSDDGRLWVSVALFSQFNCIDPVYAGYETPLSGPFEQFEEVFAEAARRLEAEVSHQLATSTLGDGFNTVPSTVDTVSWGDLGLTVPTRSTGTIDAALADVELPSRWALAPATDGAPRLVFNFPPPLERYSGEVGELEGVLDLGDAPTLDGASGWVKALTSTVTMGEDTLDSALREKMLFAPKFPDARFELGSIEATDGDASELTFGRATHIAADGRFVLMGIPIPLSVIGTLEPVIGENGEPQLQVVVSYRIRLAEPFGIEGPDGPNPANDTVIFNMSFAMEAAPAS